MPEIPKTCPPEMQRFCKTIKDGGYPLNVKGRPLGDFLDDLEKACRGNKNEALACFIQNKGECGMSPSGWGHLSRDHKWLVSVHTEPLGDIDFHKF